MKLTLQNASTIVDKALAKAREAKYRPMCVAVLDDGGNLKALKREDGASILRPNIAVGKAWGAGGVLIMDGNEIIGAVGVSGGTADEDEICAIEGIKAAGLTHKI